MNKTNIKKCIMHFTSILIFLMLCNGNNYSYILNTNKPLTRDEFIIELGPQNKDKFFMNIKNVIEKTINIRMKNELQKVKEQLEFINSSYVINQDKEKTFYTPKVLLYYEPYYYEDYIDYTIELYNEFATNKINDIPDKIEFFVNKYMPSNKYYTKMLKKTGYENLRFTYSDDGFYNIIVYAYDGKIKNGKEIAFEKAKNALHNEIKKNEQNLSILDENAFKNKIENATTLKTIDENGNPYDATSIKFGTYFINKNKDDVSAIEWLVADVDKEQGIAFLITKYVIDQCPFSITENYSYKTSELRKWLNEYFLETAFLESERDMIFENEYITYTEFFNSYKLKDKIFLLGVIDYKLHILAENSSVFDGNPKLASKPTEYALFKSKYKLELDEDEYASYWLRDTYDSWVRIIKGKTGKEYRRKQFDDSIGVRPCMWIKYK